jgi:nascent polypeptide-associated complex subunit alpha
MAKAMQRMGIRQEEVEAQQVIIKCADRDIVIDKPQVSKVNMMGQETWQVVGEAKEQARSTEPEINEEDVKTVMDQTGKSRDEIIDEIKKTKGDLAQTILNLS